ncbi:MAG: NAD(P)-dependent oxidoreductase [Acidobacteriota bacterium]
MIVTGPTGFVGRHLVEKLLADGIHVTALTNENSGPASAGIEWTPARDAREGRAKGLFFEATALFNCAGKVSAPGAMNDANVELVRDLVSAVRGRHLHWVQLGSIGVYGRYRTGVVDEDAAVEPSNLYERTKAAADDVLMKEAAAGGIHLTILRPSMVFGDDMPSRWLTALIDSLGGQRPLLLAGGRGILPLVYIANLVEGLLACARRDPARPRVFNLSEALTVHRLMEIVGELTGVKQRPVSIPGPIAWLAAETLGRFPGFPLTPSRYEALTRMVEYPTERLKKETVYLPPMSVEDGVREVASAWRKRS